MSTRMIMLDKFKDLSGIFELTRSHLSSIRNCNTFSDFGNKRLIQLLENLVCKKYFKDPMKSKLTFF